MEYFRYFTGMIVMFVLSIWGTHFQFCGCYTQFYKHTDNLWDGKPSMPSRHSTNCSQAGQCVIRRIKFTIPKLSKLMNLRYSECMQSSAWLVRQACLVEINTGFSGKNFICFLYCIQIWLTLCCQWGCIFLSWLNSSGENRAFKYKDKMLFLWWWLVLCGIIPLIVVICRGANMAWKENGLQPCTAPSSPFPDPMNR